MVKSKNNFTSQKNALIYFAKHGIDETDLVRLARAKVCATCKIKGKRYWVWIRIGNVGGTI